jgi:hypothetical protein
MPVRQARERQDRGSASLKKTDPAREALDRLLRTPLPDKKHALRDVLRRAEDYVHALRSVYFQNPLFQLTDDEADALRAGIGPDTPLAGLVAARHRAMQPSERRYIVCCMPKSGSSFLKVALEVALELPAVSLTSFGNTWLSSQFGMNPREQELDELAMVKSALLYPQGFVAQHHTRYTTYLGLQMVAYGLTPIVTLRNIPDALVSFDDMMVAWHANAGPEAWTSDTPFPMPQDYAELASETRMRLLARSLGVWLIQFHLSWLRAQRQRLVPALVIRYEEDILDPPRLIARLSETLKLDEGQGARLREFVERPDPDRSRLNVGKAGRGRGRVPDDALVLLRDYAATFADEISSDDLESLLG